MFHTWKHPPELRADLSFFSSSSEERRLTSTIGIGTGGEESVDPSLISLTRNCGGGGIWLLNNISSIILCTDSIPALNYKFKSEIY